MRQRGTLVLKSPCQLVLKTLVRLRVNDKMDPDGAKQQGLKSPARRAGVIAAENRLERS